MTRDNRRILATARAMVHRSKNLWILIASQAACLAVGLGVHYLYVTATVMSEAEEDARTYLSAAAEPLVSELQAAGSRKSEQSDRLDHMKSIVSGWPSDESVSFTVLDEHRRIMAQSGSNGASTIPRGDEFARAQWLEPFELSGKPVRGLAPFEQGPHVAVGYMLGSGEAYLVAHRRASDIEITLADLTPSLMSAGGITFVWTCGLLGIAVYMIVSHDQDKMSRSRIGPEVEALKRAQALVRTQETVIFGLAKLADSRDPETGDHLERISFYCSSLATALRQHPKYRDVITPAFIQQIGLSSALHDIGKVGVEDAILRKPGLLTKAEFDRMKTHTSVGEECLKEIERRLGTSNFLRMAREIASFHHERWDGKGYPYGLRGEQIPLAARITAVADVYDALSSKRVYKDAYSHEQCVAIIRDESGKHFDPVLVETFLQIECTFGRIARRFRPGEAHEEEGLSEPAENVSEMPCAELAAPASSRANITAGSAP